MKKIDPAFWFYRMSTIISSFKALYRLSPKQVEAFINSYEIYNCDWVDGKATVDSKTVEYGEVKEKILDWYGVLNHLCALGEVEKMYIPPTLDLSKGVIDNQILFEKKFSQQLGMKAGDKVLELGCGKGRVAAHLASITGAHITGINIDQGQLDNAANFVKKNDLSERCQFLNVDFNNLPLPFADNSFDCLYEIQALSLSKDLEKLFGELYRVLKPRGRLSFLEWVRLPNYDPTNPHHADLMRRIKPFIGAIGTPSPKEYETFLQKTGFDVLVSEEPSLNRHQGPLIDKAGQYFATVSRIIQWLVNVRLLPKHFVLLFDRLCKDGESLCEAERLELVTTSYHLLAQKKL